MSCWASLELDSQSRSILETWPSSAAQILPDCSHLFYKLWTSESLWKTQASYHLRNTLQVEENP